MPAPDRSTSADAPGAFEAFPGGTVAAESDVAWADELVTDALQVIAEGAAALAGFGVVVLSVAGLPVVGDEPVLSVTAVAGPEETRTALLGCTEPVSSVTTDLAAAEDWGRLRFLADGPGRSWRPGDRLVAPLYDEGRVIGSLRFDDPVDGRRPDAARRRVLDHYAEQAARAVALAVHRRTLAEQVRLVAATREVVRRASRELEIGTLLQQIRRPLVTGFQALGLWAHAFAPGGSSQTTLFDARDDLAELTPDLAELAGRVARDAWRQQRVGVVSRSRLRGWLMSADEVERVRSFLDQIAAGSLLFIPIGAGPECLGTLILARDLDDSAWSEGELEVALDLGHDLGRAVLNARSFERERELVRRLRALDEHKGTLLSTMSHELKSPLAAILANLELMDGVPDLPDEVRSGLDAVTRGSRRLVRVIEDLLVLAEVGDPEAPLVSTAVDLAALVEEAADLKRAEALQRGVSIRVELPDGRVRVLGDASALDLVVANLVGNAVKYSPGGGEVVVSLSREGDRAVLACRDHGIGISEKDRSRIFEEFFRSGDRQARAETGTGLGLAIVDRVVRRHGGTVDVTSAVGQGSTFRVTLTAAPGLMATA